MHLQVAALPGARQKLLLALALTPREAQHMEKQPSVVARLWFSVLRCECAQQLYGCCCMCSCGMCALALSGCRQECIAMPLPSPPRLPRALADTQAAVKCEPAVFLSCGTLPTSQHLAVCSYIPYRYSSSQHLAGCVFIFHNSLFNAGQG